MLLIEEKMSYLMLLINRGKNGADLTQSGQLRFKKPRTFTVFR